MAELSFARRLARLRRAAGLSQYRVAQLTGLSRQAVSLLERGSVPLWPTVQALARALGVVYLGADGRCLARA